MQQPKRKLPRLREYNYSTPGAYFITICTHNKKCILGNIVSSNTTNEAQMQYTLIGEIAKTCLLDIESHYTNIKIDNWVIMPNHVHMLIQITEPLSQYQNPHPVQINYDIPNVIGKYKASVTRRVGKAFMPSEKLWQSSFYDHIIRNEEDYQKIWQYISGNTSKWLEDCFHTTPL